jgi:hypothetical protein
MRQLCPQARILAIPVMRDDGVVPESCLINTLALLLARHREALENGDPDGLVDVLSLSLGYYHEQAGDASMDAPLGALLRDFGEHGVAVVAAAGNSSTLAPMYPAGFATPLADVRRGPGAAGQRRRTQPRRHDRRVLLQRRAVGDHLSRRAATS